MSTPTDAPTTVTNIGVVMFTVSDVDAGNNPVQVSLTMTQGTLTLAQTTGLTFSGGDGFMRKDDHQLASDSIMVDSLSEEGRIGQTEVSALVGLKYEGPFDDLPAARATSGR